jgi:hypothetical protein
LRRDGNEIVGSWQLQQRSGLGVPELIVGSSQFKELIEFCTACCDKRGPERGKLNNFHC